jgi:hypothetical protein
MKNRNISFTRSILQTPRSHLFRLVPALGVIALVALVMQVSGSSAQAFTVADLNGAYADGGAGFAAIPDRPGLPISAYVPASGVGLWTFDGAGNVTASLVLNNAGHIVHPNFSGTYTVNANGTGAINWVSFGTPRSRTFVIGDGGQQVRYVETDNPPTGAVFGGTMVKQ